MAKRASGRATEEPRRRGRVALHGQARRAAAAPLPPPEPDPAGEVPPSERPPLRRVPTQERGRARVSAILDAAEHVFAELGYESATTEAIALRAGASIGSLYQFFPNKRALFEALAQRYLERSRALFDLVVPAAMQAPSWEVVLDGAVDAFWAMEVQSPAFSAVWLQGRVTRQLIDSAAELNAAFAGRAELVIAHFAPELPAEERRVVARVVIEAVSGMLFAAARGKDETSPRLVAETKRMLRAYLREVLREVRSSP